jgi:hypothetical protein
VETRSEEERGWNPLGIAKQRRGSSKSPWNCPSRWWEKLGEERSPNAESRAGQRILYRGVPDLSGEIRISRHGTWSMDHSLAQIDHVDNILKKTYTQCILDKK